MKSIRLALSTLLAVVLLSSCNTVTKPKTTQQASGVWLSVSPAMVTMDQGATQKFTATVTNGANTGVVWKVLEGEAGGTIDTEGMYKAPTSAGSFHINATSVDDRSLTFSALVSVNHVALTVAPSSADMQPNETQHFTATVTGTVNHKVQWDVAEEDGGAVSNEGVYLAPSATDRFHVVAKTDADASKAVSVPIAVSHLAVVITPAAIEISPGKTMPLTASVSGCMDDRVMWTVQEGSKGGSITSEGLYIAPSERGEYHIVATSAAHPNITGLANVVVRNSGFADAGKMTMIRLDHSATLLPNGDVLLVGGGTSTGDGYSETASAEIFDHNSKTFLPAGSLGVARRWHTATLLGDGKVLIAGGGTDGGWDYYPMNSAELYDPAAGQSTQVQNMRAARLGHTATLLPNGKVLIAGGYDPDECLSSAELFDPETRTFTSTGGMRQARWRHTATLLPDGRVLMLGGCMRCRDQRGSAEFYDPSTGLFTDAGSYRRISHTATLMDDGRILTVGGYSYDNDTQYVYYDDAQFFDVSTGEVQAAGKMSGIRIEHTATKLLSGRVLVVGGYREMSPLASAEIFDASRPAVSMVDSMTRARSGHAATRLLDGGVLITGGIYSPLSEYATTAEIFTE